jgi:xylulokinase
LAWLRIAADVMDTPVSVPAEREAAAYGAAIQAIWNYGLDRGEKIGIAEIAGRLVRRDGPVIEPDPAAAAVYREAAARFDSLTRSLATEFPRHKAFTDRLIR